MSDFGLEIPDDQRLRTYKQILPVVLVWLVWVIGAAARGPEASVTGNATWTTGLDPGAFLTEAAHEKRTKTRCA